MSSAARSPADTVREAVSSLRTVGTVFVALGAVACWLATATGRGATAVPAVASAAVLLVGPGVLYHLTAVLIRRRDVGCALLARRTAVAQSVVPVVVLIAAGVAGRTIGRSPAVWEMVWAASLPPLATLFFVPALLVQAHQIGTALAALREMPDARHGFEVRPVAPYDDARP